MCPDDLPLLLLLLLPAAARAFLPPTTDASAKLYRPHAYYAAKVAATTPFQIISALVFCFTVYGMAGLRPGTQFIVENGVTSTLLSLIAVQVRLTGWHCCSSTLQFFLHPGVSLQYTHSSRLHH